MPPSIPGLAPGFFIAAVAALQRLTVFVTARLSLELRRRTGKRIVSWGRLRGWEAAVLVEAALDSRPSTLAGPLLAAARFDSP